MDDNEPVIDLEDLEMTPLLKRVIVFSSGGPFLEGYVLSIIGVAMLKMGTELHLDAHWQGMLGVASLVGLFLGASVGGWLTDMIGRRKMFVIDLIVIAILSILCALVQEPVSLLVLRFLIGVAVGADYPIATSMIAEFSPRKYRAGAMGVIAAAWYLGANVAALVGFALYNMTNGWRYMLASSAIPCVLILVGRWDIPESPRWLVSKGRAEEAQAIVHRTLGANVRLPEAEEAAKTSVMKVLRGVYLQRIIFIGVIWLCQAIPMFAFYTFGQQIIGGAIGVDNERYALLVEILIGTFFMLGTFPAMYLCERIGRRPLIIACFAGMSVALAIVGFFPGAGIGLILGCLIAYALLAGGPGNLEWLYPNELFPTEVRATAMGFAMSLSRVGTVVSLYILPAFMATHGFAKTMLAGAVISVLGTVVSIIWAPETRGYTLAETGSVDFKGR